mgnify:CR=1 FL=1
MKNTKITITYIMATFVGLSWALSDVKAQVFSPPANMSDTTDLQSWNSDIFLDIAGNIAVVWEESTDPSDCDSNERDVMFSFSDASSINFSPPINLSNNRRVHPAPSLAIDRNNRKIGRPHV